MNGHLGSWWGLFVSFSNNSVKGLHKWACRCNNRNRVVIWVGFSGTVVLESCSFGLFFDRLAVAERYGLIT